MPSEDGLTDKIAVRIATPQDAPGVGALLSVSYPALMQAAYGEDVLAAALPLMTRANPALLASGTFYLVENDAGHIIGCGGWTAERPGTGAVVPGLAHIRHFATHPEWTGRGIGRAIYAICTDAARLSGIGRFECYSSLNATDFYASLGFERVRQVEVPMSPDFTFPSMLMAKSIDDPGPRS